MSRIVFNEPYEYVGLKPQQIRDDAHELFSSMKHKDLVNLFSTYFNTDQLAELIDDKSMGRV
jgi:hypothetical protein|tara:strand:- start:279 stop:464 length:186 start_codon:yes stop_codon:yes gene_type:complete